MNGILNLYKPQGITSHTAVSVAKRVLGVKKAGHTGTLDPMACGVLPILVGRGVKLSEYMVCDGKRYRTRLLLGITTDTQDTTGETLTKCEVDLSPESIKEAVMSFVGDYMQTPPMYSALKVDGKKLYEIARKGGEVQREARHVVIHSIDIHEVGRDFCEFTVSCSKGTYIRTLCADIGEKLGCGGTMAFLERLEAGGFDVSDSITLEELRELDENGKKSRIVSIEDFFDGLMKVKLNPFNSSLALNGAHIFLSKIKEKPEMSERVLLYTARGDFFALGEVCEVEQKPAIKPIKMFFTSEDFKS